MNFFQLLVFLVLVMEMISVFRIASVRWDLDLIIIHSYLEIHTAWSRSSWLLHIVHQACGCASLGLGSGLEYLMQWRWSQISSCERRVPFLLCWMCDCARWLFKSPTRIVGVVGSSRLLISWSVFPGLLYTTANF